MPPWSIILALLTEAPTAISEIETAFNLHPTNKIGAALSALQTAVQVGSQVAASVSQNTQATQVRPISAS